MASKTQPTKLSGADILAILNRPVATERSLGDAVVDFAADKMNLFIIGVSRITAAATVGARNAGSHYAIERSLQVARSDARLRAAASRAAERINQLMV